MDTTEKKANKKAKAQAKAIVQATAKNEAKQAVATIAATIAALPIVDNSYLNTPGKGYSKQRLARACVQAIVDAYGRQVDMYAGIIFALAGGKRLIRSLATGSDDDIKNAASECIRAYKVCATDKYTKLEQGEQWQPARAAAKAMLAYAIDHNLVPNPKVTAKG